MMTYSIGRNVKNKFGEAPSTSETSQFYDRLMEGQETRGFLGKDARYNSFKLMQKPSVQKFFVREVKKYIKSTDRVLDLGCGPGTFTCLTSELCSHVTGVDISKGFVAQASDAINQLKISNATVVHVEGKLPFQDNTFDSVLMVDVVHHLSDISEVMNEAVRVLKPEGRFILFEPNKLNPLIWIVHALDKNEWGLLKLGTPGKYRKVLTPYLNVSEISFNGIVIGPQSKLFEIISDIINYKYFRWFLGWLNPKMVIFGKNKKS